MQDTIGDTLIMCVHVLHGYLEMFPNTLYCAIARSTVKNRLCQSSLRVHSVQLNNIFCTTITYFPKEDY
ncbi:hypothetical protein XELAEV_18022512mg [Xenopus laevis]|uniref:Uncharacterized protein n=1 Tax=Xenopus laevis TaxID=8355 RepID=A0A974D2I8_XENLA|nr:hypothetical protein XELAEV_18022512mg [Xenopus laevis]